MSNNFPEPILNLPKAEMPFEGAKGYLLQGENQQVIFMEFEKDVDIPEHSHESQWEIVVNGKVDYYEGWQKYTYTKGDKFFIPKDVKHSAKVYSGYASVAFFDQKDRYNKKQ